MSNGPVSGSCCATAGGAPVAKTSIIHIRKVNQCPDGACVDDVAVDAAEDVVFAYKFARWPGALERLRGFLDCRPGLVVVS